MGNPWFGMPIGCNCIGREDAHVSIMLVKEEVDLIPAQGVHNIS